MGRTPKVSTEVTAATIKKYQDQLILQDGKNIVGVNHEVWKKIASELSTNGNNITPASIRVYVAKRKAEYLKKSNYTPLVDDDNQNESSNEKEIVTYTDETSSDECFKTDKEKLTFDITFSVEEWNSIQPREQIYMEKRGARMYNILAPFEWSNTVQDHFFLHTGLPCCLTFKKGKVSISGIVYVSLSGRCSDCGSIFNGNIDSIPAANTRVVMNCVYYGDFRVKHFKKRRLIGSQKTRALDAMCAHKVDPSVFVRNQANTLMKEGDGVPAQIPSTGALRVAKHRSIAASCYDSNPIIAISLMNKVKNLIIQSMILVLTNSLFTFGVTYNYKYIEITIKKNKSQLYRLMQPVVVAKS